ncbi:hypothetical protein GCM10009720_02330 [Yaniella flava]|uniref:Uncharacterized protein n=1 Tax=Yaniella flava TaxID=287930 RepID=A0ABN2U0L1_9MICC|nr:hypothetical protein [Micrococcaceae bacterium]
MSYPQSPQGPSQPHGYSGPPGPDSSLPPAAPQGKLRKKRRRGTGLLTAGLITLGVSIIGGIIALIMFGGSTMTSIEDFSESAYDVTEPAVVDGLGDNQWYLYQDPNAISQASCEVTDQQGNDVTNGSAQMNITNSEYDLSSVQSFESTADGVYEIQCSSYPVVLGGAVPLGGIFGVLGTVLVAGFLFVVGAVLTIIGLVMRSNSKKNDMPPMNPPYGAAPQPGYGYSQQQQPYYGQQSPQYGGGQQPPQYGGGPAGGYPPNQSPN